MNAESDNTYAKELSHLTKEMTHGSPMRLILGFTIPLLFGNIFQQVYSMVDAAIVGRILGTNALAAVGSTGAVTFLLIGFSLGICSGFAIPIAQCFGAREYGELKKYLGNSIVLLAGFAVVFTVATVLLCRSILEWMDTGPEIIDDAYRYLVVIFAGIPATLLYNTVSGIQRALGDSRTPVIFLVISSLLNVALDFLLIEFIPLGVAGAAWATVISQLLCGLACLIYTAKKYDVVRLGRGDLRLSRSHSLRLINMGLPMALQTSITAIGNVVLQKFVNDLGTTAVASITAGNKVFMLFDCGTGALGVTMSNYAGQNLGARKFDRISQGVRTCTVIGCIYSVIGLLVLVFIGKPMLNLFLEAGETAVMEGGYLFIVINGAFLIPLMLVNSIRLVIQGMGYSRLAMFAGVFEMVARSVAGLFLVPAFGFTAACFAGPLAWLMADSFLIPAYLHSMKRARREYGAEQSVLSA